MNWKLKKTQEGRPYLAVEYSSRLDWTEAISAALAGAGVRRNQLICILASPATAARANFETISGEGLLF